jgi:hypothetical protein
MLEHHPAELQQVQKVLLELFSPLWRHKFHAIVMDNYFTSIKMAEWLYTRYQTLMISVYKGRSSHDGYPFKHPGKALVKKLGHGYSKQAVKKIQGTNGYVLAEVWIDKQAVKLIGTASIGAA